MSIYDKFIINN